MTAYRSTTDEMLAAHFDPKPWVTTWLDGLRTRTASQTHRGNAVFDPRPESIPDRECLSCPEPNPILVALRDDLPGLGWSRAEKYRDFLDALLNSESFIWGMDATPAQIEHAIRVLLRLVALA